MNKKTAKIILGSAIGLTAAAGAGFLFCKALLDLGVKRNIIQLPVEVLDKISGGLASSPEAETMRKAEEGVNSLKTEDVTLKNSEGMTLSAQIFEAEAPKRIVIAMHGWRSSWQRDFGCSAAFFHNSDCTMIYPHQRGTNDSDGDYIGFGVLERYDCLDWINYAVERYGKDIPIYLYGISMGSTTVLMTSGFTLPENVKGIIADCGFTSPHDIWAYILDNNLHLSEKITYPIVNGLLKKEAQYGGDDYSTKEALAVNRIPVLFIHGSADKFVPLEMTFDNYLTCTAEKELFIVPGASHGVSYITDTAGYQKAVTNFFKKHG